MPSITDFATAISCRLADEWDGAEEFPEDADLLRAILEKLLISHPEDCRQLIGTGIIENGYFDDA